MQPDTLVPLRDSLPLDDLNYRDRYVIELREFACPDINLRVFTGEFLGYRTLPAHPQGVIFGMCCSKRVRQFWRTQILKISKANA